MHAAMSLASSRKVTGGREGERERERARERDRESESKLESEARCCQKPLLRTEDAPPTSPLIRRHHEPSRIPQTLQHSAV